MTRFARADGSKGSNKREPEDATPWSVMVKQMQSKQVNEDVEDDVEYTVGEENNQKDDIIDQGKDSSESEEETAPDDVNMYDIKVSDREETKSTEKSLEVADISKKKKRKKSEKCKICGEKGHRKMDCERLPEDRRKELKELYTMKVERKGKGTGRKKNKNKSDLLPYESKIERKEDSGVDMDQNESNDSDEKENKFLASQNQRKKSKKKPKKDKSGAFIEEGEGLFQGFRVRLEDQQRLEELSKKLKGTGMPHVELEATLKRERRIAEKSLARSKKLVCFNCRQPGHMLADCPSATVSEAAQPASGHCFKCGSLEHTSKDCKSKLRRENAYRFAVCFICKEEGHLAKACPDNPKGLYPKGGGCIFCGSVEHLKRDCPRKVEKDLKQGVRIGMIGDNNLEDEVIYDVGSKQKTKPAKKRKIVAF